MKKYGIVLLVLLLLGVVACTLPSKIFTPQASLLGLKDYVLVAPPGSSPTPTPFQPIPPTPTYLPTSLAPEATATAQPPTPIQDIEYTSDLGGNWEDYPGPSVWPDIDVPAPLGILSHPEGQG